MRLDISKKPAAKCRPVIERASLWTRATSPKDARAIRILTANLCRGRADASALSALIERLQVDVVCAQELRPWLVAALPQGRLGANHRRRDVGIACRYGAEVVELPLPRRSGWAARLSPTAWPQLHTPIDIVSAHIMAPHMRPYSLNRSVRRGQLAGLLDFLAREPDVPKAILGDLNASPIVARISPARQPFD